MIKKLRLYIIPIIISLIFNIIFLINKDINSHNLSDSFFITSIIFISIGSYSYILRKGAFSGLSHSLRRIKHLLFTPKAEFEGPQTYHDKYIYDIEKRKENKLYLTLLLIGIVDLVIAIIFTYVV